MGREFIVEVTYTCDNPDCDDSGKTYRNQSITRCDRKAYDNGYRATPERYNTKYYCHRCQEDFIKDE